MPVTLRMEVVLALHELLVNIVAHAYAGAEGQIDLDIQQTADALTLTVTDQAATAFELPESIAAPDLSDLPESGMGLFIIREVFDDVNYMHLAPGNRWILHKTLRT